MPATGGLELALQAAARDDRRLRFAQVKLRTAGIEDALCLVTDARGRMRYRLPAGGYQRSFLGGPRVRFVVRDRCWITVGLQLAWPEGRPAAFRADPGAHRPASALPAGARKQIRLRDALT